MMTFHKINIYEFTLMMLKCKWSSPYDNSHTLSHSFLYTYVLHYTSFNGQCTTCYKVKNKIKHNSIHNPLSNRVTSYNAQFARFCTCSNELNNILVSNLPAKKWKIEETYQLSKNWITCEQFIKIWQLLQ